MKIEYKKEPQYVIDKRERLIKNKEIEIIRRLAIDELKKEGKLKE